MHRLTLTDYLLTILLILAIVFSVSYLLQTWLNRVAQKTSTRIQSAQY